MLPESGLSETICFNVNHVSRECDDKWGLKYAMSGQRLLTWDVKFNNILIAVKVY